MRRPEPLPAAEERRRYRRLQAPVFVRPAGRHLFTRRPVGDIGLGGMRVYSDEPHDVGSRLEMDLQLPDGSELVLLAEVAWVEELEPSAPARFDVGLRFVDPSPLTLDALRAVLGEP